MTNVARATSKTPPIHRPGKCRCGRAEKRPNQGNCKLCNAEANAASRRRAANQEEATRRALLRRMRESVAP